MQNLVLFDKVFQASKVALDGLSARQEAISRNITNVDTPGYKAETVSFENTVKQVLNQNKQLELNKTNSAHLAALNEQTSFSTEFRPGGSVRADQNNVDIDVELTDQVNTETRYEAVTQLVNTRFRLLSDISKI